MKIAFILVVHFVATILKLMGPGGARAVIAETMTIKHQLLIANRPRKRAPNLTPMDRALLGIWSLLIRPHRLPKVAVVVSIATLHRFHDALKKRKYRRLFSAHTLGKPGPKGPSQELINAIVQLKTHNPRFGCPRIAQQLAKAFGIEIDKDVVRRVLAKHYRPVPGGGPSWLTVIGHAKDSLWSADLFRCESILWVANFRVSFQIPSTGMNSGE